jgi:hypothetical protein
MTVYRDAPGPFFVPNPGKGASADPLADVTARARAVPLGKWRAVLWRADLPAIFEWPRPGVVR